MKTIKNYSSKKSNKSFFIKAIMLMIVIFGLSANLFSQHLFTKRKYMKGNYKEEMGWFKSKSKKNEINNAYTSIPVTAKIIENLNDTTAYTKVDTVDNKNALNHNTLQANTTLLLSSIKKENTIKSVVLNNKYDSKRYQTNKDIQIENIPVRIKISEKITTQSQSLSKRVCKKQNITIDKSQDDGDAIIAFLRVLGLFIFIIVIIPYFAFLFFACLLLGTLSTILLSALLLAIAIALTIMIYKNKF